MTEKSEKTQELEEQFMEELHTLIENYQDNQGGKYIPRNLMFICNRHHKEVHCMELGCGK